jgi:hypothetical protein
MSPEQATLGAWADGQPFTVTERAPHMANWQVAKFLAAEPVLVAENGLHIRKGVALVGMAVGTRDARAVGRLVGSAEGLVVGTVDGGDITFPMICTVPVHVPLPKQPCLTVNVWH